VLLLCLTFIVFADDSSEAETASEPVNSESGGTTISSSDSTIPPTPVDSDKNTPPIEESQLDSGDTDLYYKFGGVKPSQSPVSYPGSFDTSLFTGSASYTYELNIPKGINGLSPKVFLNYDSQGAKGRAGVSGLGWAQAMNIQH